MRQACVHNWLKSVKLFALCWPMTPVLPMVADVWLPPLLLSSVAELLVEGTSDTKIGVLY